MSFQKRDRHSRGMVQDKPWVLERLLNNYTVVYATPGVVDAIMLPGLVIASIKQVPQAFGSRNG